MDYCKISLNDAIEKDMKIDKGVIACQICSALLFMHECNTMHRDLKPDNIMLHCENNTYTVRLCDFGTAKKIDGLNNSIQGTRTFKAPEVDLK